MVVAIACAGALAFAGCGSSDDSGSTSTSSSTSGSATTASADAPTGTPVKLGVVYTTGSPIQNSGQVAAADKAAIAVLNANGGLAGHPVELVTCDDKGDPNETATCGRKMVSEKVAAVAGGVLINGAALNPILAAAKIPQVGIVPYVPVEFNAKNVYTFNGGGFFAESFLAAYAGKEQLKTSIVAAQSAAAQGFVKGMEATISAMGSKYVNNVPVSANQADWAPIVAGVTRNGADTAQSLVDTEQTKQLLAANESAGAPIKHVLTISPFSAADSDAIGGDAAFSRIVIGSPFPPFNQDSPTMSRFRDELAAEEKTGDADAALGKQDLASLGGWLSIQALAELAKNGALKGDVTAASVTAALDSAKDLDLGGLIPPWTPTAPGPKGFSRVSNTKNYLIVYDGTEPKLLTPKPLSIEDVAAGKAPALPAS
jgi:ABC-type branched-subunit amino acid transport system substrate-binding protein